MVHEKERLHFVQWLRVFLISLVVAHHAGQPYGPTGGEWPVDDPTNSEPLLLFFAVNAAFFMGFFFLISGYFIEGSYDRKGARAFLSGRLLRLGLPLVVLVIFLNGSFGYATTDTPRGYFGFLLLDYVGGGNLEFGPLWFIEHLLVYALLYTLVRLLFPARPPRTEPGPPGHLAILAYTITLAGVTVLVRQTWPIDEWRLLFGVLLLEPAHLPQYASLFLIGILAGRGRWFEQIEKRIAYTWFWIGIGAFAAAGVLIATDAETPAWLTPMDVWAVLEAFVCVGMILGLLAFFHAHVDQAGPLQRRLSDNAYGVYLIHVYVVIGLQVALLGVAWPALAKFVFVTVSGIALSLLVVDTLRRLAWVRAVV